MPYYKQHIFLCSNERDNNRDCCAKRGSKPLLNYLKTRMRMLNEKKEKKIRVSSAGCLGRCEEGPVLVIYPEGIWYYCETEQDIDEIIEKHILNNLIVARLLLSHEDETL